MRITALVKSREHVCCRYRVSAYRASFEAAGHSLALRSWSGASVLRQILPSWLGGAETLLVQRKLYSPWTLQLLRRRARWLLFDLDDAIFLRSSYHPDGIDSPERLQQFKDMVQAADLVIAGNSFLRDHASDWTDPAKIALIPTCVEPARYPLAKHLDGGKPVKLAWIGSSSTLRGLRRIAGLLDSLTDAVQGLQLRVICDRSLELEQLPVDFRFWSEASEARDLAEADIGISWLPDDLWSEGKCGLKVLQYMAAGLPVIANPVGMQKTLVRHGENGFLVESAEEWRDAVRLLGRDPDLRRQMGRAGRARVEAEFAVARGAAAWRGILHSLGLASRPLVSSEAWMSPATI